MCKIHIVDAPCGAGKTSGAINLINSFDNNKYLYITPFLDEVARIKENCKIKKFCEPQEQGSKLNSIHWLLSNDKNIVSTHSLFLNFNDYTLEILQQKDYTLILDEVVDVVKIMDISRDDLKSILKDYAHIEDGLLIWDYKEYEGNFEYIKNLALNKCIGIYGDTALIWCFPVEIFKVFKEVYILTYMFEAQIQKYYYNFYDVEYDYKFVEHINNKYKFTDYKTNYDLCKNYNSLINVLDNETLNSIGLKETALSVSWFTRDKFTSRKPLIKTLQNNLGNYFKHIIKSPSELNMWTTFKDFKKLLQGGGYAKGFVAVNARATNNYRNKTNLAYCANIFMNPVLKQFFIQKDIEVNEETYALSELVQWIWRSAIRDNKAINIYIPSSRMRGLLVNWLESL